MSLIETISDVKNTFLSRRELTCNFAGLGGKLKKVEAVDMISKEFKLDGKTIIPIKLQTHVGKPLITGTFYVYEDEKLAKEHVNPVLFARLEKANKTSEEASAETVEAKPEEGADKKKDETPTDAKIEEKAKETPKETPKEAKTEEKKESKKGSE